MRHNVALDGLSLSVDRGGSGQPFIWGHGLTSSMDLEGELLDFDWRSIAARSEVIRYDARGHQHSVTTPGSASLTTNSLSLTLSTCRPTSREARRWEPVPLFMQRSQHRLELAV